LTFHLSAIECHETLFRSQIRDCEKSTKNEMSRKLQIGIIESLTPYVTECGRNATVTCRYPGTLVELFHHIAAYVHLGSTDFTIVPLTTHYSWGTLVDALNGIHLSPQNASEQLAMQERSTATWA